MGGLISRRDRNKIDAAGDSESTQPTKPLVFKRDTQGQADLADGQCRVEEITDSSTFLDTQELEEAFTHTKLDESNAEPELQLFNKPENKTPSSRLSATVRSWSSGEKLESQNTYANTEQYHQLEYDFPGLPGQVSPGFRTPMKKNSSTGSANDQDYIEAANSPLDDSEPESHQPDAISGSAETADNHHASTDEALPTHLHKSSSETRDPAVQDSDISQNLLAMVYSDRNVKAGTGLHFSRSLRHRRMCDHARRETRGVNSRQAQLSQVSDPKRLTPVPEDSAGGHQLLKMLQKHRSETAIASERSGGPVSVPSRANSGSKPEPEFRLSLEQIFQSNVPLHAEAMEVAAVTGTESVKQELSQKQVPELIPFTIVQGGAGEGVFGKAEPQELKKKVDVGLQVTTGLSMAGEKEKMGDSEIDYGYVGCVIE